MSLFDDSAFAQIPGQLALEQYERLYFVTYELIDRNGYKLARAFNSYRATSPQAAAQLACQSAESRGLTAEIIMVQA